MDALARNSLELMVPATLRDGLRAYFDEHRPVGDFLRACLENDLRGAAARADATSRLALADVADWIRYYAPAEAWGSVEVVTRWLGDRPSATEDLIRMSDSPGRLGDGRAR